MVASPLHECYRLRSCSAYSQARPSRVTSALGSGEVALGNADPPMLARDLLPANWRCHAVAWSALTGLGLAFEVQLQSGSPTLARDLLPANWRCHAVSDGCARSAACKLALPWSSVRAVVLKNLGLSPGWGWLLMCSPKPRYLHGFGPWKCPKHCYLHGFGPWKCPKPRYLHGFGPWKCPKLCYLHGFGPWKCPKPRYLHGFPGLRKICRASEELRSSGGAEV